MRRILPEPAADTSVPELMAELHPSQDPPEDRPRVLTNFALTLDGHSTIGGVSKPIGSEADTDMLVGLRTRVDAVMIGAGTMRAERYGRLVLDPKKRELRERDGLPPDPLMVIVSGRLDLPWDAPIFTGDAGSVVVFTLSDEAPPATRAPVEVVRHRGEVDLAAALVHLRHEHGVRSVLCEGGAHLHGELHRACLVDEMFLTLAPKLAGGGGPGLVAGLSQGERPLELTWLATEPSTGELFARYRVSR